MRIYLAGRFDRLPELNSYAVQLRQKGHIVECRWLNGSHQFHPGAAFVDSSVVEDGIPMEARLFAEDDIEDLAKSDAIILFSESPESHSKRGGRHVEFGMAIAMGKHLFVVGPRENVFHCLRMVTRFNTWPECLEAL